MGQGGCSGHTTCCPFYRIDSPNLCTDSCPANMTGIASNNYICGELLAHTFIIQLNQVSTPSTENSSKSKYQFRKKN